MNMSNGSTTQARARLALGDRDRARTLLERYLAEPEGRNFLMEAEGAQGGAKLNSIRQRI